MISKYILKEIGLRGKSKPLSIELNSTSDSLRRLLSMENIPFQVVLSVTAE